MQPGSDYGTICGSDDDVEEDFVYYSSTRYLLMTLRSDAVVQSGGFSGNVRAVNGKLTQTALHCNALKKIAIHKNCILFIEKTFIQRSIHNLIYTNAPISLYSLYGIINQIVDD